MTTPAAPPPSHLADLLSARDSSLPLAAAALARVGDAQGRAPFADVAADRAGMADRLLEVAERALARAESPSGEHAVVSGGSRLEAHGLVKTYKGRRVVNDVSVRLEQGEIVGLLGPNGAGKTTCFYMITGLIRPDGGEIVLDGRDITPEPMYRRARMGIGYLAQEPSVFRKLTVE